MLSTNSKIRSCPSSATTVDGGVDAVDDVDVLGDRGALEGQALLVPAFPDDDLDTVGVISTSDSQERPFGSSTIDSLLMS